MAEEYALYSSKEDEMMNKTIAASMVELTLSACMTDEGRDAGVDDERGFVLAETMTEILSWVGAEAGSFVAGEIFGLTLPEDAADLSEESIEEIELIVDSSIREALLTQYGGELNAVVERFNRYSRNACKGGVNSSNDCTVTELNKKRGNARSISEDSLKLHGIYSHWVTETNEDVKTDTHWQVFLAGNIRLAMTIDMAMLREIYEIERLQGLSTARDTWEDIQRNASDYVNDLKYIESKYNEIKSKFGTVHVTNHGTWSNKLFKACFDAPEGKVCSPSQATKKCTSSITGSYCGERNGPSDAALQAEGKALKTERMDRFEKLVLGSPEEFDEMKATLDTIHTQPFVPIAGVEYDCEDISESAPGSDKCWTGIHRSYDPTTGEHFYTNNLYEAKSSSYKLEGENYFYLYSRNLPGLSALYRCLKGNGMRFYTSHAQCEGQQVEGVLGYMANQAGVAGSDPLYRLYSGKHGDHLYTTSAGEREAASGASYKYEGVAAYVW